jgi:putative tricarboxylic transport membrane protein
MKSFSITAALAGAIAIGAAGTAQAWQPTKPVEFVVTSGPAAAPTISPA